MKLAAVPQVPVLPGPPPPRKKKQPPTPPSSFSTKLVGTLAGVGALGAGTAYGIASDADAAQLEGALQRSQQPLAPHETPKTRYQDVMSTAASMKPFGIPASTLMVAGRTMQAMGRRRRSRWGRVP